MSKFRITYNNNISQVKVLISHDYYLSFVKPILEKSYQIELEMCSVSKKNKRYKELSTELKEVKKPLVSLGEWFTDRSPLGFALFNGGKLVLPSTQGGTSDVKFEKL